MVDMTPDQHEEDHAGYLAEISPDLVAHPHGTFVVAWLDGEPAGCGALKPLDAGSGVAEVKRMYTAPVARRRGVSRAVLSRLEAVAAALGYRTLQLETGTAQPEALALYASHGWHRIALYGRYQDDPDSVCFAKDLRPA
ncbi:MAG: GNAT family N-acetyltransferase [Acidimicrobiia bacterium]|nr:GNAT family N-acetyltransferase [Acidimicrobiia bacterium]